MTAVDVDALDALAAALDDTATGLWMGQHGPGWGRVVANALLPVVDRIANQRAAAELRAAAEDLHVQRFNADSDPEVRWPSGAPRAPDSFYAGILRARIALRAKATDLDPSR